MFLLLGIEVLAGLVGVGSWLIAGALGFHGETAALVTGVLAGSLTMLGVGVMLAQEDR